MAQAASFGRPAHPLREAHAHIAQHGRAMEMVALGSCVSREACLQRLAEAASAQRGGWILGVGVRVEGWSEPAWPSLDELDEAVGGRPCAVWSFDHHALMASSAALKAGGISPDSDDPLNGRIVRDERGRPTGVLLEAAAKLVWSAVPEPSGEDRRRQVRAAMADFARHGFVEVHDLHAPRWLGPVLAELEDAGELSLSVRVYPPLAEIEAAAEEARGWTRDRVRLAGAKLFADGTLNSRTAWMLGPYADGHPGMPCGQVMATPPEIEEAIERVRRLGLGLAVHAIGDGAVRAVLDACEHALTGRPGAGRGVPGDVPIVRIEHAEVIDEADVPRFGRMGVVASVQPCHLLADIEALRRSLPHRLERVLPLRELIDAGCRPGELLWFGSDAPIVRPDPEDSVLAAVRRRREGMTEAIAPGQAIAEAEAWMGFSLPARACGS